MWKPFISSFIAIVVVYVAGMVTQGSGYSMGVSALLTIGFALMGYSFTMHRKWCDEKNYSERVINKLATDKVYAVLDRGTVGKDSVSFLYDAVGKKSVVYRGPFTPKGFYEVKADRTTYLVPDGKKLGLGDKDEFICVRPM